MARALKIQSGLSTNFWTYFRGHVVHLINRSPTPLLDDLTLYEKLYKKPMYYDDIKYFGCLAYVSTFGRDRSKFDDRADRGIFVGYENGMKGYKIYNLKSKKVVVSRNVIFFMKAFFLKSKIMLIVYQKILNLMEK